MVVVYLLKLSSSCLIYVVFSLIELAINLVITEFQWTCSAELSQLITNPTLTRVLFSRLIWALGTGGMLESGGARSTSAFRFFELLVTLILACYLSLAQCSPNFCIPLLHEVSTFYLNYYDYFSKLTIDFI